MFDIMFIIFLRNCYDANIGKQVRGALAKNGHSFAEKRHSFAENGHGLSENGHSSFIWSKISIKNHIELIKSTKNDTLVLNRFLG